MSCWKDVVEIISKIVTSLGILLGGLWTYRLFVKQRLGAPKIQLSLNVDRVQIEESLTLFHVSLKIKNVGNVILKSDYAEIRLRQVSPIPEELKIDFKPGFDPVKENEKEIAWPQIAGREWNWNKGGFEIEPGEEDSLHTDFVINSDIKIIEFYCYINNLKKKRNGLGWPLTEIYNCNQE
jgi:hypothetical protein